MDSLKKIKLLMKQQHMTETKLAKASGVSPSTINSLFRKGNTPTIPTLEGLCKGLNISLSDFFYERGPHLNEDKESERMLQKWNLLTKKQKDVLLDVIDMLLED